MTYFFKNLFYQKNRKEAKYIGRGQIRGALFNFFVLKNCPFLHLPDAAFSSYNNTWPIMINTERHQFDFIKSFDISYPLILVLMALHHPIQHSNPFLAWIDSEIVILLTSTSKILTGLFAPWNSSFFCLYLMQLYRSHTSTDFIFYNLQQKYISLFDSNTFSFLAWYIQAIHTD